MKPSQIIRLDSRTKKKEIELDLEGQQNSAQEEGQTFGETVRTAEHIW